MSKHWMDKVWSWDHCFNALALAAGQPELAWDQFQLPVRPPGRHRRAARLGHPLRGPLQLRQAAHPRLGAAPAAPAARRRWTAAELTDVYDRLAALDRASGSPPAGRPGSGLPHYQHGNDSGWDNATTFDPDRVVETADLAAFLVLQLRELADLAAELGDAPRRPRVDARPPTRCARRCSTSCGPATGSSPAAAGTGRDLDQRQPARPDADRARRANCPTTIARRAGRAASSPPDRVRAGHRAARPHRTTRPTATGAARSGPPPPSSSRTACAAPGTPTSPTRSAAGSARCARSPASPRTSTP